MTIIPQFSPRLVQSRLEELEEHLQFLQEKNRGVNLGLAKEAMEEARTCFGEIAASSTWDFSPVLERIREAEDIAHHLVLTGLQGELEEKISVLPLAEADRLRAEAKKFSGADTEFGTTIRSLVCLAKEARELGRRHEEARRHREEVERRKKAPLSASLLTIAANRH